MLGPAWSTPLGQIPGSSRGSAAQYPWGPNRYSFNEHLAAALKRAHRTKTLTGLLFLDVDKFKLVNETHGHGVGDDVLREFASRLQGSVREKDFVGRLAGDEFVVILEGLHASDEAEAIAVAYSSGREQPVQHDEHAIQCS